MKRFIRIVCFALLFCLAFLTSGCVNESTSRRSPHYYEGSVWKSEDGKVRFTIPQSANGDYFGTYENDGVPVEMFYKFSTWHSIEGCTLEDYNNLEPDEYGIKHLSKTSSYETYRFTDMHADEGWFVAQIVHSNIYEKGEKIKFYSTD